MQFQFREHQPQKLSGSTHTCQFNFRDRHHLLEPGTPNNQLSTKSLHDLFSPSWQADIISSHRHFFSQTLQTSSAKAEQGAFQAVITPSYTSLMMAERPKGRKR
eukprot:TRINITY_DN8458_c0_g1_i1.p1 TRINITY_DN8458_c0_g1~~TRINITY_DN8458_c0_g1_i1.p1  ORF type:complete len:104 (-),score=8.96 TRINITY_DN8458_c0_g1_i1:61-372(-)